MAISAPPPDSVDVLVIGAGLSGLQAAVDLQAAGYSVLVLEARGRVGGMTYSVPSAAGAGTVDFGAEWLNDVTQTEAHALATRLGVELQPVHSQGDCLLQGFGDDVVRHTNGAVAELPGGKAPEVARIRAELERAIQALDGSRPAPAALAAATVADFVDQLGAGGERYVHETVAVWTRVMLGCEPRELGAACFLEYCRSQGGLMQMRSRPGQSRGQYMSIKSGAQSLAQGLQADLAPQSVILDSPVVAVSQTDAGVCVRTSPAAGGLVYRGRKAVLALPSPLCRAIEFAPSLPPGRLAYSSATRLGFYAKVVLVYAEPWWRSQGLCGAAQSLQGPVTITCDTSDDATGKYRLTCFLVGEPGRRWSRLDPGQRRQQVLEQAARLFANPKAQAPAEMLEFSWIAEEWSRGCPCPFTPAGLPAELVFRAGDASGNLHFVGTEYAKEWMGYMEGALRSAKRGAREVIDALRGGA